MFGIILVISVIICICFFILYKIYDDDASPVFAGVSFFIVFAMTIAWPCIYFESKNRVGEIEALKGVIENSRSNDMTARERIDLIPKVMKYNEYIVSWKNYGDNWYASDWIYHDSTKGIEFIK